MRQGPGVFAPGMPLSSGRGLDGPGAQPVTSAAGVQCLLPVYTGDRADGDPGRSRRQCPPGPGAELSHLHSAPARRCAAAQEPEFKREAPRRMTASRDLFTACSRRRSSVNSAWSYAIRAAPARQRHAERRHPLPSARSNPRSSADAGQSSVSVSRSLRPNAAQAGAPGRFALPGTTAGEPLQCLGVVRPGWTGRRFMNHWRQTRSLRANL